jgi:hypothetical protein
VRITGVAVDGVGRFGATSRMTGFGPGVNILAAANEAGKSTFFKAIRACLFERHTARNDALRGLASTGLALPVTVSLGFEHGGKSYEIAKSFIKSPSASLTRDGVEMARGREADEAVWDILAITPGSGRSVDESAFGILWVSQGHSFHVPEPSEAATTALNAAIQQEVGTLVGGERARQVLATLKTGLALLVTEGGKPKAGGAFAEATTQLVNVAAALETATGKLAELDQHLDELEAARGERKNTADPALVQQTIRDLEDARKSLKEGEAAAAMLRQCEVDEQRAHALFDAQRIQLVDLQERAGRIDHNRRRCDDIGLALLPLDETETTARNLIATAALEITGLDRDSERQDARERILQRVATTIDRMAARAALIQRLEALRQFDDRLIRNEAALKANAMTETAAVTLDTIERELGNLAARVEAGAARVAIEFASAAGVPIVLDGEPLAAGTARAVVDPMTIAVGGIAKITISPPPGSLTSAHAQRRDLSDKLKLLLDGCAAATAAEARRLRAARASFETEARVLQAERAALGLGKMTAATEIAQVRTELEGIGTSLTQALADLDVEALPVRDDIARRRDDLARSRTTGRARRGELDAIIAAENGKLGAIANERGLLRGTLSEIQNRLDADLAILADTDRAKLFSEAEEALLKRQTEHRAKAAFLEEKRSATPTFEELERRRNRAGRLETAVENQKSSLAKLDLRIANLEGQIQTLGGDGLGEKVAELRERHEIALRERDRQNSRVGTLKLLRDVIETSYLSRREQLNAPLRRHLQPYLDDIFPQAEIELGEGFAITGIKRLGPSAEDFARLSAGTQEQIAVLVRLAMGAMIGERGHDVPIILDDALVFSDDDRIEQMFDALTRAGQKQQVIVLTCRTRAFAKLGGRQLSIVTGAGQPPAVP